ncbi:MAG: hypothetical protein FWD03_00265 [Defluviitaleaceae bacterium]|nr:hypothetical protein [Defluviitaleaceae bacterium]
MLQNRKAAWLIAIALMILGLFMGSYLSYRSMRSRAVNVFRVEAEPIVNQQIQLLHNMLTLYSIHAPENQATEDLAASVNQTIAWVQRELETINMSIPWTAQVESWAHELYNRADSLPLDENDARRMQGLLFDIEELTLVLRQSPYNAVAIEYNNMTRQGLGFLTHNNAAYRILRNHWQLPHFGLPSDFE